jgi:ketosteroid isomerase-like protein
MHPNADVIARFYTSLQKSDIQGIRDCYAPDAVYWDPVFRELRGERAIAMWDMLCERGDELRVDFGDIQADESTGSARWEARYTFSKTGRSVHNVIDSRFWFADGLIREQRDTFDVHRWAGMALGLPGRLLGWSPPLRAVLHRQSAKLIDNFTAQQGSA